MSLFKKITTPIAYLLAIFFLVSGSVKVFALGAEFQHQLELLISFGLNRQIMFAIGVLEIFGAGAIVFHGRHWLGLCGALALMCVAAGAVTFHFIFDPVFGGTAAGIMLILSSLVMSANFNYFSDLRTKMRT